MSEAAFAQIGVTREALNRALMWGRDLARRLEEGERLTRDEIGGHEFYVRVAMARGGLRESLYSQVRGVVGEDNGRPITDPKAESAGALKVLVLIDPELRAPAYDPQELEAIQAAARARSGAQTPDPPAAPPTDPTPAQAEAYLRREADRLGFTLTPKPAEE